MLVKQSGGMSIPTRMNHKATYHFVCAACGKPFEAYGNSKGNTAPIAVTSMLDSKVVTAMNKQQLEAEQQYYIAMSAAKSMFQNGIISAEVLAIIDTKLLEKMEAYFCYIIVRHSVDFIAF